MKFQVFTVFDAKAEVYAQPFYAPTKGVALRSFTDTCNDRGHPFNEHPEDYVLFHLGEWEDTDASFTPFAAPMNLGVAIEFVARSQNVQEVS